MSRLHRGRRQLRDQLSEVARERGFFRNSQAREGVTRITVEKSAKVCSGVKPAQRIDSMCFST